MKCIVSLIVLLLLSAFCTGGIAYAQSDTCYVSLIGNADGDDTGDIDDTVYILMYIFQMGPAPTPYPVASGDVNCDCKVDIDDVVASICYIFVEGCGPECSCEEWVAACGPLH